MIACMSRGVRPQDPVAAHEERARQHPDVPCTLAVRVPRAFGAPLRAPNGGTEHLEQAAAVDTERRVEPLLAVGNGACRRPMALQEGEPMKKKSTRG
jgi:hypothetical protein